MCIRDRYQEAGVIFPLLLSACGVVASIIGALIVRAGNNSNPHRALKSGEYSATALVVAASFLLSYIYFGSFNAAFALSLIHI